MQRFDVYFKRIFSQHADAILSIFNLVLPVNCGDKVVAEPSVEVVKGALRIDKIYKTNTGLLLIMDFEEPFVLDSYFEILMHTAAHIHSTKYHKEIVRRDDLSIDYVPILLSITANAKHMEFMKRRGLMMRLSAGVYQVHATPFFHVYLLLFNEFNLAAHLLRILGLCKTDEECYKLGEQLRDPKLWESALKGGDAELKSVMRHLVSSYGKLLFLMSPQAEFFFQVWRFSSAEVQHVSKDILEAMLILFFKEVMQMSVSEVLTKKEIRKFIETMGIAKAIEAIGIERVIEAVGIEKVVEAVGVEKVIKTVGVDKTIEVLGRILNLSEEEKANLLKRYKQGKKI